MPNYTTMCWMIETVERSAQITWEKFVQNNSKIHAKLKLPTVRLIAL